MPDRAVEVAERFVAPLRSFENDFGVVMWTWGDETGGRKNKAKAEAARAAEVARVAALLRPVLDAEHDAACEKCLKKICAEQKSLEKSFRKAVAGGFLGSADSFGYAERTLSELAAACRALKRGGGE